ncbi:tRNA pseudouridine synthase B [Secundilactobacillus kimchicus JCM 15530]|uniref:tRNA pseudouridine synthase B n=2 Tax=Secundilactobacillus kimchicus TaxID=528209 RepID=A0A0R1HSM5_9LACO|nr:tRNA pseudouridine(55) synthase TruB [Secundilactobacillus kimchicus]KRK49436.1 tRNA pseudouridine synthase B [Secundilactobacillus kimchicus JCM 15530]
MDGIIALYKERGLTSHDCVNRLRKLLHTKKVGHSGTLDPNVDGVLPICVGSATKVVDFLMTHDKVYRGSVTFGFSTETEDLDGAEVTRTILSAPISTDQIDAEMQTMTGTLTQVPPMYSAVKVKGRKLYEYARAGQTVERPSRQVMIKRFKRLASPTFDEQSGTQTVAFGVTCSKGTYVRTLAVELGQRLGVPAVMSSLTRLSSGGFDLAETWTFEQLTSAIAAGDESFLQPIDRALSDYPVVELSDYLWSGVKNGIWLKEAEVNQSASVVALRYQGAIKCLYQKKGAVYKPLKMFSTT